MKLYLTCFLSLLFFASNAQVLSDKVVMINPHLSFQNYEHFPRLVLSSDDINIEFIKDFNFEWGYTYQLSVKETKLEEALSDGTQYRHSLNKIISKIRVPDSTQFKLYLYQDFNFTFMELNDSTYKYMDKVEIEVPSHLTTQFNKLLRGEISGFGYFTYINEQRIKLVSL